MDTTLSADWVSAISAVGGVVVSIVAACIAEKSASSAKISAQIAEKVIRRSLMRDLVTACHELIAAEFSVKALSDDLRIEHRTHSSLIGLSSNSRECLTIEKIEQNLTTIEIWTKEAKLIAKEQANLNLSKDDDIVIMLGRVAEAKAKIQTIRETMIRDLENVRAQNLKLQEQRGTW